MNNANISASTAQTAVSDKELARKMSPEEIRAFNTAHFTHKEAAFTLGISPRTLSRWRKMGKIAAVRAFAPWFYPINAVRTLAGLNPLEFHA